MLCFKCKGETFDKRVENVTQEYRGETLTFETPLSACRYCGWQGLDDGQADELRTRTIKAYAIKMLWRAAKDGVEKGFSITRRNALKKAVDDFETTQQHNIRS